MENNKYYTPEIEEFRVGFEYEASPNGKEWIKFIFPKYPRAGIEWNTDDPYRIIGRIKHCRVKYLDAQDIEELGFKPVIPYGVEDITKYRITSWTTNEHGDGVQILHEYPYKGKYFISFGQNEYNKPLFKGTILNKSELKWILTRIGVL